MHSVKLLLNHYNNNLSSCYKDINTNKSCKSVYEYNYFSVLVLMVTKLQRGKTKQSFEILNYLPQL